MNRPRLDDVAVFVKVVETGSFSAAARALFAPKSSVSRAVARLESNLGVQLLHRTTRALSLTESGDVYHQVVAGALGEVDDAAAALVDERNEPSGTIRISAPPDVGAEVLARLVAAFVSENPLVRIDVDLTSDSPNLIADGVDLAIVAGQPTDASLSAVKLQDTRFGLYATPSHLDTHGRPGTIDDLAGHPCVLFHGRNGTARWELTGSGRKRIVNVTGAVSANDLSFVRNATLANGGMALLPELVGEVLVADRQLERALSEWHAVGNPLFLVRPSTRYVPLRVSAFTDFALTHFPQ